MIYKRGQIYWYKFMWEGKTIYQSTKQKNERVAISMESAHRTRIALGEAGIGERPSVPTLREFSERFQDEVEIKRADHPLTIDFYKQKMSALLKFEPMAKSRLDKIDEQLISTFVRNERKKRKVAPATVNRELATLKKALRLAVRWKIITSVPYIEMLTGERMREYTLPLEEQIAYLNGCDGWFRNIAEFGLETGMRRTEIVSLKKTDVHLDPAGKALRGWVHIPGGKTAYAKRNLSMTVSMRAVLEQQMKISKCDYVFVSEDDAKQPICANHLSKRQAKVRNFLGLHEDFVVHSWRHTMLTRLGESGADAFTIMRIAGHSTILVSQRYVHPTAGTIERAFINLEELTQAVEQPVVTEKKRGVVTNLGTTQLRIVSGSSQVQ